MILSFNTAYYEYGSIVKERMKIATHVLGKFWGIEVLSVIYLLFLLFIDTEGLGSKNVGFKIGLFTFFVQVGNIARLIRHVEEVLNLSKPQSSMLELAKLIMAVMYVLHVFSCLWFWVNRYFTYYLHLVW